MGSLARPNSFNTQPPEGGWNTLSRRKSPTSGFNTQPPEGGWGVVFTTKYLIAQVSTHSRPKAAGLCASFGAEGMLCFNTQPPEGGWFGFVC